LKNNLSPVGEAPLHREISKKRSEKKKFRKESSTLFSIFPFTIFFYRFSDDNFSSKETPELKDFFSFSKNTQRNTKPVKL